MWFATAWSLRCVSGLAATSERLLATPSFSFGLATSPAAAGVVLLTLRGAKKERNIFGAGCTLPQSPASSQGRCRGHATLRTKSAAQMFCLRFWTCSCGVSTPGLLVPPNRAYHVFAPSQCVCSVSPCQLQQRLCNNTRAQCWRSVFIAAHP